MKKSIFYILLFSSFLMLSIALADTTYEWQTNKPTDYQIILKDNGQVYMTVSLDFFVKMLQENKRDMKQGQIRMNALRAAKVDMMNEYIRMRDGEKWLRIGPDIFYINVSGIATGINPQQEGNHLAVLLGTYKSADGIIHIDWRSK